MRSSALAVSGAYLFRDLPPEISNEIPHRLVSRHGKHASPDSRARFGGASTRRTTRRSIEPLWPWDTRPPVRNAPCAPPDASRRRLQPSNAVTFITAPTPSVASEPKAMEGGPADEAVDAAFRRRSALPGVRADSPVLLATLHTFRAALRCVLGRGRSSRWGQEARWSRGGRPGQNHCPIPV